MFDYDANYNSVKYVTIQGDLSASSVGVIEFDGTPNTAAYSGNKYDTISNSVSTHRYGGLGDLDFEKEETFDEFGNTIKLHEMKATSPYEDYDHSQLTFSETGKAYIETEKFYNYNQALIKIAINNF